MHLQRQIQKLKKVILELGALVEENVYHAMRAIEDRDPDLARQIIESDRAVDEMEIEVEEECLHTLALHQPVAFDLRFVVAVLKINSDLERIGDLSVNVAEMAELMSRSPRPKHMPCDISGLSRKVQSMLRRSLNALVNIDVEMARQVIATDDEIDRIHREVFEKVEKFIRDDPTSLQPLLQIASVVRHLERIADHAVNIAEDIIYMANGDILRHGQRSESELPAS